MLLRPARYDGKQGLSLRLTTLPQLSQKNPTSFALLSSRVIIKVVLDVRTCPGIPSPTSLGLVETERLSWSRTSRTQVRQYLVSNARSRTHGSDRSVRPVWFRIAFQVALCASAIARLTRLFGVRLSVSALVHHRSASFNCRTCWHLHFFFVNTLAWRRSLKKKIITLVCCCLAVRSRSSMTTLVCPIRMPLPQSAPP